MPPKKDGKIISMYLKLLILGMNLIFNSSLQMKDAWMQINSAY